MTLYESILIVFWLSLKSLQTLLSWSFRRWHYPSSLNFSFSSCFRFRVIICNCLLISSSLMILWLRDNLVLDNSSWLRSNSIFNLEKWDSTSLRCDLSDSSYRWAECLDASTFWFSYLNLSIYIVFDWDSWVFKLSIDYISANRAW